MTTLNEAVEIKKDKELNKSKIYIACLASYNSGVLSGEWIEPSTDKDELEEQIANVLKSSPSPNAEEFAIHDYEYFPDIGEYPGLDKIIEVKEAINKNGFSVVNGFIENFSVDDLDHIEDAFHGTYDCFKDYAEEYAEDCILIDCPEHIKNYIDYDQIASELKMDMCESDAENFKVHIFNNTW